MHKRFFGALIFATLALVPFLTTVQAQTDTVDAAAKAEVTTTVNQIFELAAAGDYNTMYDMMHPDAQAVVDRSVALNLFSDVYSQALPAEAQIVSMDFGSWTWPVNGQTYPEAAAVTYVMPVRNEAGEATWVEDIMYLATEQGAWYWFLGSSQEFIDQINAQYADAAPPTEVADAPVDQATSLSDVSRDEVLQIVVNDLDNFFRAQVEGVEDADIEYETPGVVVVAEGDTVQSACGPASTGFYGFYCPLDATMYLDEPFLLGMVDEGSPFSAAFVVAHEWAHHVQTGIGFERTQQPGGWNQVHSIELELMADCFAGAWAWDAEVRGLVEPGDITTAVSDLVFTLGDPKFIGEYDPQAHGNGEQRVRATLNGYEQGFAGCNLQI
jgi:predicted metalloprotease